MKKVTATFEDRDIEAIHHILVKAVDIRIETVNGVAVKRHVVRKVNGLGVPETIMSHFTPGGAFTSKIARSWLKSVGFAENSVYGGLTLLLKRGYISQRSANNWLFIRQLKGELKR